MRKTVFLITAFIVCCVFMSACSGSGEASKFYGQWDWVESGGRSGTMEFFKDGTYGGNPLQHRDTSWKIGENGVLWIATRQFQYEFNGKDELSFFGDWGRFTLNRVK